MAGEAPIQGIAADARPSRRTGWSLEVFEGGHVLYDPAAERVIEFNQTAALIWHLCDGTRTVAEIGTMIADAYPDERERVLRDVMTGLEELRAAGSIVLS